MSKKTWRLVPASCCDPRTSGTPRSPPWLTCISSGTRPRTGTSRRCARASNCAGGPNRGYVAPVSGARKCDMLRTSPRICVSESTYRHVHLVKHGDPLARVYEGDLLRRADHHGAVQQNQLTETQRDIAGARRHINHQDVKWRQVRRGRIDVRRHARTPVHVKEQLLYGLHHHEAAPYDGRVCVGARRRRRQQEAHRHARYAIVGKRDQRALWC